MLKACLLFISLLSVTFYAKALTTNSGLVRIKSAYSVSETISRLESVLKSKGMTIFNRVKHSDAAEKIGIDMRPTELLIFGNPKIGSKLMQCAQTSSIDLPLKAIAYQDQTGDIWLSYNKPSYLKLRHDIKGCDKVIAKMTNALKMFTLKATSK